MLIPAAYILIRSSVMMHGQVYIKCSIHVLAFGGKDKCLDGYLSELTALLYLCAYLLKRRIHLLLKKKSRIYIY